MGNGVATHTVKLNGVLYKAGDTIPAFSHTPEKEVLVKEKKKYTRSDIQLMKSDDLKKLAESEGIPNALETSGNQLKKILMEHFEL